MKTIILSSILLLIATFSANASGLFKASLYVENTNKLIITTQPFGGDININGFSQVEFFLRVPSTAPSFSVLSVTVNSNNFPGNIPLNFVGQTETGGFRVYWFASSPTDSGVPVSYTEGEEYTLAEVILDTENDLTGVVFQLVTDFNNFSTYLNLTSNSGADLTYSTCIFSNTCPGEHIFYGNISQAGGVYVVDVNEGPLPIQLTDFSAKAMENKYTSLEWVTQSEINASYFSIQKSGDAREWKEIGKVNAVGSISNTNQYEWKDEDISSNNGSEITWYYRLKMVDLDESVEYSYIRSATFIFEDNNCLSIYPNPCSSEVYISQNCMDASGKEIMLIDVHGKAVYFQSVSLGENSPISVGFLPPGVYSVRVILQDGNSIKSKSLLIKQ